MTAKKTNLSLFAKTLFLDYRQSLEFLRDISKTMLVLT